ncbi:hypothetical protein HDU76_007133, partial [Blyttiomyces sp. JEL0837]
MQSSPGLSLSTLLSAALEGRDPEDEEEEEQEEQEQEQEHSVSANTNHVTDSESTTDGGVKPRRKYVSVAPPTNHATRRWSCEECRARKIKCDGERPICGYCTKKGYTECIYLGSKLKGEPPKRIRNRPKKGRKSNSNNQSTDAASSNGGAEQTLAGDEEYRSSGEAWERYDGMESISHYSAYDTAMALPSSAAISTQPMPGDLSFATNNSNDRLFAGQAELATMSNINMQHASQQQRPTFEQQHQTHSISTGPIGQSSISLPHPTSSAMEYRSRRPDLHTIISAAAVVEKNLMDLDISISNRPTITLTPPLSNMMSAASDPPAPRIEDVFPFPTRDNAPKGELRRLINRLTVAAAGALVGSELPLPKKDAMWYYSRARSISSEAVETPSIETLQALIILAFTSAYTGKTSAAWMILGMGCRMALLLKLNIDPDHDGSLQIDPSDWVEKETRRRLWWSCYVLDRIVSVMSNRTPFFDKSEVSVKHFCNEDLWESLKLPSQLESQYYNPTNESCNPAHYLVRLADIFQRVVNFAGQGPAAKPNRTRAESSMMVIANLLNMESDSTPVIMTNPASRHKLSVQELQYQSLRSELTDWSDTIHPSLRIVMSDEWFFEVMNDPVGPPWRTFLLHFLYFASLCMLNRPKMLMYLRLDALERRKSGNGGGDAHFMDSGTNEGSVAGYQDHDLLNLSSEERRRLSNAFEEGRSCAESIGTLVNNIISANATAIDMPGFVCVFAFQGAMTLVLLLNHAAKYTPDSPNVRRWQVLLRSLLLFYKIIEVEWHIGKFLSASLRSMLHAVKLREDLIVEDLFGERVGLGATGSGNGSSAESRARGGYGGVSISEEVGGSSSSGNNGGPEKPVCGEVDTGEEPDDAFAAPHKSDRYKMHAQMIKSYT